jgi:hypothetical protein
MFGRLERHFDSSCRGNQPLSPTRTTQRTQRAQRTLNRPLTILGCAQVQRQSQFYLHRPNLAVICASCATSSLIAVGASAVNIYLLNTRHSRSNPTPSSHRFSDVNTFKKRSSLATQLRQLPESSSRCSVERTHGERSRADASADTIPDQFR